MSADDMLSWLRSTITAELEAARAADQVAPGPWVNTGQRGCGDAWQIHGAPTTDSDLRWSEEAQDVVPEGCRVATLNYEDGGGVWEREAADHIVLQQPRDVIARCEAELALLDKLLPDLSAADRLIEGEWGSSDDLADRMLATLVSGYRHRDGFNPEWVEG